MLSHSETQMITLELNSRLPLGPDPKDTIAGREKNNLYRPLYIVGFV